MAATQTSQSHSASTIVLASVGAVTALALGYAVYFDHRRRSDPAFRRQLKRAQRQASKAEKESALSAEKQRAVRIRHAVDEANAEGFPTDQDLSESYFMDQVERGERLTAERADEVDTALCFYRALKVYPQPRELIGIYEKTVTKPIIDILAEMIAIDKDIPLASLRASSPSSAPVE